MNALPDYDDRYIKIKIRKYSVEAYTNHFCLNVSEDVVEYKFYTIISVDFWRVYEKNIPCKYIYGAFTLFYLLL